MRISRALHRHALVLATLVALGLAIGFAGRAQATSVPAAPTNLHLCQPTPQAPCWNLAGSVTVYWNDNAFDETKYILQWVHAAPPLVWQSSPLPANSSMATALGLTPGQRYYFRVQTCNASGCSAFSNTIAGWP